MNHNKQESDKLIKGINNIIILINRKINKHTRT